ncbi:MULTISPECIES: S41 family peptidase [Bacillota]|uniref:S41 family peptidase n=1 Tax=Bacillota TaxID=1239 RepID=UPI0009EB1F78|nr:MULTISPECIES: S41 family peptidase [Bacillota]
MPSKNHDSKFSRIVLLVGKGIISAADPVTGIRVNNNKKVVIGTESTFGKNTVQKTLH